MYCDLFYPPQVLQPPAGYVPIRTPARKLTATPTPMGGMSGGGFHMQSEGGTVDPGLAQPPGNLPFLKPDDTQYFGKLLVRKIRVTFYVCVCVCFWY